MVGIINRMIIRNFKKEKGLGMEKIYDVLEFYKIINNLIDLARLETTKDKFIDTNIIKSKSELDKEMILMQEFIDYYKYDDGLDIVNISNIQRHINSIGLIGSYLSSEELVDLKKNLVTYRISRSRTKNVRDKYRASWLLFSDVDDLKDIEKYIEDVANDDGTLKDDASIGLREIRRQKYNLNGNIKEKFDDIREKAAKLGRKVKFGLRLQVIVRETEEEAWEAANKLISHLDEETIKSAQERQKSSDSVGQARINALHNGDINNLVISPNLWAGIGLVRSGAGTALVGNPEQIAARIKEYVELGADTFVFSGYPNLEESIRFAELVFPLLGKDSIFEEDQVVTGGGFEVGQTFVKAGIKRNIENKKI